MSPNRRTVSCPDLFVLDDHHWHVIQAKPAAIDVHAHYWHWPVNEDELRRHDEQLEQESVDDIAVRFDNHESQSSDFSESAPEPDSVGTSNHYWTWVHWPERLPDDGTSHPHYWAESHVPSEHHAVKHIYKTGLKHAPPKRRTDTELEDIVDYWHGM